MGTSVQKPVIPTRKLIQPDPTRGIIETPNTMAENDVDVNEELLDYEDEPETEVGGEGESAVDTAQAQNGKVKGNYVSIHSSGFRDFLLKPEVLRSIVDCGFEHPSEVQHECIPQAVLGMDVLCQAKSGMGKTAVFVWPPCSRSSLWTVRS